MDIAFSGCVNVISIGGVLILLSNLKKEQAELDSLKNTKTYTPSKLLNNLKKDSFLEKWRSDSDGSNEYKERLFIEGITACRKPIKSTLRPEIDLVYSSFYRKDIFSNENIVDPTFRDLNEDITRNLRMPMDFQLVDLEGGKCNVHHSLELKPVSVLERIDTRRQLKELSPVEQVLISINTAVEFVCGILGGFSVFKGYKIGMEEGEFGIRLNSVLTAYGDVIYNRDTNTISIEQPLYLLASKAGLVELIKSEMADMKGSLIFAGICFTLSGAYLLWRLRDWAKNRQGGIVIGGNAPPPIAGEQQ